MLISCSSHPNATAVSWALPLRLIGKLLFLGCRVKTECPKYFGHPRTIVIWHMVSISLLIAGHQWNFNERFYCWVTHYMDQIVSMDTTISFVSGWKFKKMTRTTQEKNRNNLNRLCYMALGSITVISKSSLLKRLMLVTLQFAAHQDENLL